MFEFNEKVTLAAGVLILLFCLGYGVTLGASTAHVETYSNCVVSGRDRVAKTQETPASSRVYTSCGVFKVEDSWLDGRFNSADVYGSLREGKTYDLKARGFRVPFLSWFPNVIGVVEK